MLATSSLWKNQIYCQIAVILITSLILAACTTKPTAQPNAIHHDAEPMIALEVHRDSANFFIKLHQGGRILYVGGHWSGRTSENSNLDSQQYAAPSLVPIQYYQTESWESLPVEARKLPIFSVAKWHLLRNRLFSSLVPRDGTGLVMNFEYEEYFLFYDRQGKFQAERLVDKPSDYSVRGYLHFDKFIHRAGQILKEYLLEQGITQTEFVFNTGDEGLYSLPFLYVNTDKHRLVFFRNVPLQPVTMTTLPGMKGGQTFGHVLRSHLSNVYTRPVSSLFRLVTVISDTAVTTASFEWATALRKMPVPPLNDAPPMNLQAWEHDLDKITKHPQTVGSIDFLVDGEAFFTRFIDTISAARSSVHLQTYIFDNDDYAIQIADLLKRRSNEGVTVKVLLDGFGTITATMEDSPSQPEYHKAPISVRHYLKKNSAVDVRQKENPWLTGDHVKSTIIDHETAFVGGMNIGREYRYDWHDLMIELHGPVVDTVEKEFLKAWAKAGPLGDLGYLFSRAKLLGESQIKNGDSALRVLLTSPGNYEIYRSQLEAIRRSQSYIYIQNAYITNDRLLRELVKARRRGVDVRVVTPLETDHGPITRSNILAANVMLENGIRVYIYPGFSHVKAAIYDGWVCVGSANFDRLSLRVNRELNIASSDANVAQQLLENLFLPDFQRSAELTEALPERWVDRLVEIVSDYIY